ncbi:NADPH:quinone oxidoreductase family protein [Streptomyces hirsutus]|uniref:NADPH:quinone oxidoreductase family protein n=1 Tax=Streptomyces hirsutus TaxID=35620 RepID=UPI00341AB260
MKAFELRDYVGPGGLVLADVARPPERDDQVLMAVEAVGINFPDLLLTKGTYQYKPELPTVPGCELAGRVESAPAGSGFTAGDKVAGFVWSGAFAEYAGVPLHSIAPIPAGLSVEEAAGTMVNYHTALFALQHRGGLEAGENVLVMGAAGGVGTAAIQVARGLGAHVVAGVSSEKRIGIARQAGAHEVLLLKEGFAPEVRDLSAGGRGIDVVVDPVGSWLFSEALRTLEPDGRIIVIGFAAGDIPSVAVNRVLLRNISVVGAAYGAFHDLDHGLMARQTETLADLVAAGHVRPVIEGVYDFEGLPELLLKLDRGEVAGKAVVSLRSGA